MKAGEPFQRGLASFAGLLLSALVVGCITQPEIVTPTQNLSTAVPSATKAPSATAELLPTPTAGPSPRPTGTPSPTPAVISAAPVELPSLFTGTLPSGSIARLGNGFIRSIMLSPDGKLLAVGTSTGLNMYDAVSLQILWTDATARTGLFAWSADSTMITSPIGGTLAVITWDALSGERLYTMTGHSRGISDLGWSPVENLLASASSDGSIILWDGETGTRLRTLPYSDIGHLYPDFDYEKHKGEMVWFQFSPDGTMLASRYQVPEGADPFLDKLVTIWDVQTGQLKHVLEDPPGSNMLWSQDSLFLATHEKIWDVSTGQVVGDLEDDYTELGCPKTMWDHYWSPESNLAARTRSSYLKICTGDGELLYVLEGVRGFGGWSPDGTQFMTFTGSGRRPVIYSANGELLYELGTGIYCGTSCNIHRSPDWTRFYYVVSEGWYDRKVLEAWNIGDEPSRTVVAADSSPLLLLAWSPDGKRLATIPSGESLDRENRMTVWDMETLKPMKIFTGAFFTWTPDLLTAAGWTEEYFTIQDAHTDEVIKIYIGEEVRWRNPILSPDGGLLVTGGEEGLYVWDTKDGELLQYRPLGGISIISWLPNSHKLAYENGDQFYLWDVLTDEEVSSRPIGQWIGYKSSSADSIANDEYFTWSPSGDLMAFIEKESTNVLIYATDSLELVHKIEIEEDQAVDLAFSPDGTQIATITNQEALSTLRVWDVSNGRLLWEWHQPESPVSWRNGLTRIAWSPDAKYVAAGFGPLPVGYVISNRAYSSYGSEPGQVILLDAETGHVLGTFEGHTGGVEDVAFSPDGSVLASASLDGTVILWDVSQ